MAYFALSYISFLAPQKTGVSCKATSGGARESHVEESSEEIRGEEARISTSSSNASLEDAILDGGGGGGRVDGYTGGEGGTIS